MPFPFFPPLFDLIHALSLLWQCRCYKKTKRTIYHISKWICLARFFVSLIGAHLNFVDVFSNSAFSPSRTCTRFCIASRFFISCALSLANRLSSKSFCLPRFCSCAKSICNWSHLVVMSSKSAMALMSLPLVTLYWLVRRSKFALIAPFFRFSWTLLACIVSNCAVKWNEWKSRRNLWDLGEKLHRRGKFSSPEKRNFSIVLLKSFSRWKFHWKWRAIDPMLVSL